MHPRNVKQLLLYSAKPFRINMGFEISLCYNKVCKWSVLTTLTFSSTTKLTLTRAKLLQTTLKDEILRFFCFETSRDGLKLTGEDNFWAIVFAIQKSIPKKSH